MFEIVAATKKNLTNESAVREALKVARPGWIIENIDDKGKDGWLIRLFKNEKSSNRRVAEMPPFMKNKKDESDGPSDSASDEGSDDMETDDDSESDMGADDSSDSDSKNKKNNPDGAGDLKTLLADLKRLQGDLDHAVKELAGKADQVGSKAQEHADKLDKAQDILGDAEGEKPPMGGPPMGDEMGGGGAPPMGGPKPPRRPGVPSGGAPRPGLPSTFTNKTEIITHPGYDNEGQRVSLVTAALELEEDREFADYEVVSMTENTDGTYSAKLKLR